MSTAASLLDQINGESSNLNPPLPLKKSILKTTNNSTSTSTSTSSLSTSTSTASKVLESNLVSVIETRIDKGEGTANALKVEPLTSISATSSRLEKGKGRATTGSEVEPAIDSNEFLKRRLAGPSDQKAGLNVRDKEEVANIIYEISKGSKYFLREQQKDKELTIKVDKLLANLNEMVEKRDGDLSLEESLVDEMIRDLESTRVVDQVIVVADADMFFAACAQREDPSLVGTAFAVGEGVLTTCSYEARKFGCRSAQAGFVAKKLCPHLRFVKLDFQLYVKCSKEIFEILETYGPLVAGSLDEAYISLTDYCAKEAISPAEAANRMREEVKTKTSLTVSAGVSCNSLVSKIAADQNKPDGQCVIEPNAESVMEFMHKLLIRKVPGIGRVSERWLRGLGVETVGDIYKERGKLYLVRKEIGLSGLLRAYLGLGSTTISQPLRSDRKGIGQEETFTPTSDLKAIDERLKKIADDLAFQMSKQKFSGKTINLKIKFDTYESLTRALTIGPYFSDSITLYKEAKKLLDKLILERYKSFDEGKTVKGSNGKREMKLRLIGIRMSNLRDEKRSKKEGLESWRIKKETKSEKKKQSKSMITGLEEEEFAQVDDEDSEEEEEEEVNSDDDLEKVQLKQQEAAAGEGIAKRTCFICNREIVSSLISLNAHVMEHLEAQSKPSASKVGSSSTSNSSSSNLKRKNSEPSAGSRSSSSKKGKKNQDNAFVGYFTKK